MRILVAFALGAFFGFAAMAVVSVRAKQDAYDEGVRDGSKMMEDYIFEELEWQRARKTVSVDADGPRYADMCCHYHDQTVEDVLREFAHTGIRIGCSDGINAEFKFYADDDAVTKYAKLLQLKEVDR